MRSGLIAVGGLLAVTRAAATPEAYAAATLVPLRGSYPPAVAEMSCSPGATTSGFGRPSRVGPTAEKNDTPWLAGVLLCAEPTVRAISALPGSVMPPRYVPVLPAATTTSTPVAANSFTALHTEIGRAAGRGGG